MLSVFDMVVKITRPIFLLLAAWLLFVLPGGMALADYIGQVTPFFIDSQYDALGRTSTDGILIKTTPHAYFYVEQGFYNNLSENGRTVFSAGVDRLADEFESRIYPIETGFWGSEFNPGVDNDSHITLYLTPLIDVAGGYYDSKHQNLKSSVPDSNQREMVYLNADSIADFSRIRAFLAHEFQHMINFHQKEFQRRVIEDTWLNELRSEYSITLLGYNDNYIGSVLQRRVQAFLDNPRDSLTEWKNQSADYGIVNMFSEYLVQKYGADVFVDSMRSNSVGIPSLNESLLEKGAPPFKEVFRDWAITSAINQDTLNGRYSYTKEGLRDIKLPSTVVVNMIDDFTNYIRTDQIKDWAVQSYTLSGFDSGIKPVLEFQFKGDALFATQISIIKHSKNGEVAVESYESPSKIYLEDLSSIQRIVLLVMQGEKLQGFGRNEPASNFSFAFKRIDSIPAVFSSSSPAPSPTQTPVPATQSAGIAPAPVPLANFPNGSLLRGRGDYRVYVINNGWRRHILNPQIFGFYGFKFNQVIEVDPAIISAYPESRMVRYVNDKKVYEIDANAVKHWLNMTAGAFESAGRKWDAIFIINQKELNFYRAGTQYSQ